MIYILEGHVVQLRIRELKGVPQTLSRFGAEPTLKFKFQLRLTQGLGILVSAL